MAPSQSNHVGGWFDCPSFPHWSYLPKPSLEPPLSVPRASIHTQAGMRKRHTCLITESRQDWDVVEQTFAVEPSGRPGARLYAASERTTGFR